MGKSLIPWSGPGSLVPETGRRHLAVLSQNVAVLGRNFAVLSENRAIRKLSSVFLGLVGTFAIAVFMLTASEQPARGTQVRAGADTATAPISGAMSQQAEQYLSLAAEIDTLSPFDTADYAAPFIFSRAGGDRINAGDCLATAGWYEAGDDPESQRSVMQVVLNRVQHPGFPNSVCAVVFQGSERITGCQFSFTCDGSMRRRKPPRAQWARAKMLSERALSGAVDDSVRQATHFHADYVSPWWRWSLIEVGRVGSHIFYRWPGQRGALTRKGMRTEAEAALTDLTRGAGPHMVAEAINPGAEISGAALSAMRTPLGEGDGAALAGAPNPYPNREVVHLTSWAQNGRWAMESMKMCSGKSDCRVVGFASAWQADDNSSRAAASMDRPLFVFARDSVSGRDLALWDCARVKRNLARECLPDDKAEISALIGN